MRLRISFFALLVLLGASCNNTTTSTTSQQSSTTAKSDKLAKLLSDYWEQRMQLFPTEATANGDNRYNDRMTITISESFRDSTRRFFQANLDALKSIDTATLNGDDKMSYELFRYEMVMNLEGLKFPTHLMPINQFWAPTLDLALMGSGDGNQPFKTVQDYDNWLKRVAVFPAWTDTAIANMRKGIATGNVLPKTLVVKVLPQLKSMLVQPDSSVFYGPVRKLPASFGAADKKRFTDSYLAMIKNNIIPNYQKLYDFFSKEYLPKARTGSGIADIPQGKEYYSYLIKSWTTTDLTADSVYNLGMSEVKRIEAEMNKVKDEVGFKGDMHSFFEFLNKDKQFMPFKTPKDVLDSFWAIKKTEDPKLKELFNNVPKSPFTIRQTEAFRAASASAEYNPPSKDGSRPGIFYVPVLNAEKFNAVGMETLFLHEAIPGHHYQISLQQENTNLPEFRKFLWYGAYGEGWALYSESLGKELGLFKNQYQYFGHLSDAMHRAIRLVVDPGMHSKGMTREQAVDFMVAHERITKEEATTEIERYMAIPGQALSYKIGQLSIRALRTRYEHELGAKFKIASFHDEVLKNGCVPLNILAENLAAWAKTQQ